MAGVEDRIIINAAIQRLIKDGYEESVARIVIRFGHTLKAESSFTFEGERRGSPGHDTVVTGHTPEHGDIIIQGEIDEDESKVDSFGMHRERIGYFTLWKVREGLLHFQHFWKSRVATQGISGDRPDIYHLTYDTETFMPRYFGVERESVILSFGSYQLLRIYLEILFGKKRFPTLVLKLKIPLP